MTYAHELNRVIKIIPELTKDIVPLQFTGLKDKKGKEIYEGDIIKCHREAYFQETQFQEESSVDQDLIGEVVIIASRGVCLRKPKYDCNLSGEKGRLNFYYQVAGYRSEVIGNIYENKDLLV